MGGAQGGREGGRERGLFLLLDAWSEKWFLLFKIGEKPQWMSLFIFDWL